MMRVLGHVVTQAPRPPDAASASTPGSQAAVSVRLRGDDPTGHRPQVPSAVRPLGEPKDAFAVRVALIRAARHTLDVQYYIWHNDLAGSLLLAEIEAAAERGVQVRLLLDDNGIAGMDARLAATGRRPNIEVRLYNPFALRFPKAANWLFAFARLNRRMHAKSLTADKRLTIVGGRNVGDEYFGATAERPFSDLDVVAAGPAVAEVLQSFGKHWRSGRTRAAEQVLANVSPAAMRRAAEQGAKCQSGAAAERYRDALRALPLAEDLHDGEMNLIPAAARAVAVHPDGHHEAEGKCGLAQLLPAGLGHPARELIVVSGYFVPTAQGCDDLAALARSGVAVRVLTNSFASTDVGLVHAGYAPCRSRLLEAGVALFEMPAPDDRPKTAGKFIRSGSAKSRQHSGKSLHAKAYIVDRQRVYIGSANFDPRSVRLNTELGLVIESASLAEAMAREFDVAANDSYRLFLGSDGGLRWSDLRDDTPTLERREPGTTVLTRTVIGLLARLPLQRHL